MRSSGWISWAAQPVGKEEAVPPIPPDTTVEAMFKNGVLRTCPARMLYWGEDVRASVMTIVAYRIVWEGDR